MPAANHVIGMTLQSSPITKSEIPQSPPARQLLEDVVRHKSIFYRVSYANYEACLAGGLRLIPEKPLSDALRLDYEK